MGKNIPSNDNSDLKNLKNFAKTMEKMLKFKHNIPGLFVFSMF